MFKQSLPAVSTLTPDSIEEFKTSENVVVVAFLDADDKSTNTTITSIADELRDKYLFGATHDKDLAEKEGVKRPGIVLYKQFDEGKDILDGKLDKESVEKFIKTASVPLIGEVGPETYADYMAVSGLHKPPMR